MSAHDPSRTADFTPPDSPTADPNRETVAPPAGAGPATLPHATADTGTLPDIPGYAVEGEIARGGMGVVYRARHLRLNRPAAVKMILGDGHHDPAARIRFLVEAEAIAALDHPHVVHVHEFGTHDGLPFFALEYVGGGTLAEKLARDGKPAPRAATELLVKLADGIAAAHAKGIVHRDLKPSNVLLTQSGEPKVADFGLAKVGRSDMTATGAVMGTPSYMSPEQAAGRVREVGTHSDVYALGAILYELLTGRPPFRGESAQETIQQVLTREPERPRSIDPTVPRDLETVCLKCLAKDAKKRYATADALAADLRAFLAGRPIAARPVGAAERAWKWVKRNPGRAAVIAGAALVVVGGIVAAFQVQRVLADQRVAAEQKRLEDLRAADEEASRKERQAKAEALVRALTVAEPGAVPVLIDELAEYRELASPHLLELSRRPVKERAGFHARLALLRDSETRPGAAGALRWEVVRHAGECRVEELPVILDSLGTDPPDDFRRDFRLSVAAGFRGDPFSGGNFLFLRRHLRMAAILARLEPNGPDWPQYADTIAKQMVRLNPLELEPFARALHPVRARLLPPLVRLYGDLRRRIDSGKLSISELTAEASAFDLAANLLARYVTDRPADLAEFAVAVDARHYPLFADAVQQNRAAVVPLLRIELDRPALPRWAGNGGSGPAAAAVVGAPAVAEVLDADAVIGARARRRGHAAAALLTLGEAEAVWPLFRFPADGDPTARSYLLARLAGVGADPVVLLSRFLNEQDLSAKRAILIALGDVPPEVLRDGQRAEAVTKVLLGEWLNLYRVHPDPGLHSAIDWLLRQKWGKAKEIAAIDAELAAAARGRRALPAVAGPATAPTKDWFVNGEGQTFAVVRGPVEFTMGSPPTEPGRAEVSEPPHPKRIGRTFAVATKEVTVEQFLRFRPDHEWTRRYSPGPDTPAVTVTWYDAAGYCNWLSEREGIPPDQWCYEPNKDGKYAIGMRMKEGHLKLTGYRLPTEAEWEFACRAGTTTARYYGRGEELLPRYGWFAGVSDDRTWPVGTLRPNERGLFDTQGNASEWCEDPGLYYQTGQREDAEIGRLLVIDDRTPRVLRGGSFGNQPIHLRSAHRNNLQPVARNYVAGFRPTRTLPE